MVPAYPSADFPSSAGAVWFAARRWLYNGLELSPRDVARTVPYLVSSFARIRAFRSALFTSWM